MERTIGLEPMTCRLRIAGISVGAASCTKTVRTDGGSFGSSGINRMQGERHSLRHNHATIFSAEEAGVLFGPATPLLDSHESDLMCHATWRYAG